MTYLKGWDGLVAVLVLCPGAIAQDSPPTVESRQERPGVTTPAPKAPAAQSPARGGGSAAPS